MSQPPKLVRLPSIRDRVEGTLSAHRNELVSLLSRLVLFPSLSTALFIRIIMYLLHQVNLRFKMLVALEKN
ncbi:putative sucrose synthase [Medicago truncatula]|uniref:Putative sucrose synthase n=1 Tax=Medicago truncatula TaxID=3880 RepID=A0A396JS04_MEDTR|nr:putative sucrose synthase [Medicago truncatula]